MFGRDRNTETDRNMLVSALLRTDCRSNEIIIIANFLSKNDREAQIGQETDPVVSREKRKLRRQTEKELSNTKGCKVGCLTSQVHIVS